MRIEQLYYLVEVVKAESISQAAENIFVTKQTITQAINNLEDELGAKLLIRSHKGVTLTKCGAIFVENTQKVLSAFGELKTICTNQQRDDDVLVGNLEIYSSSVVCQSMIYQSISEIYEDYPTISVKLTEENPADILNILQEKGGIGFISILAEYFNEFLSDRYKDYLSWEVMDFGELFAYVSAKSPLALKKSISLPELFQLPLAIFGEHDFSHMTALLNNDEIKKNNIIIQTSNRVIVEKTIAKGDAVGLYCDLKFLKSKAHFEKSKFKIIPIKENLHVAILIVRTKNKKMSTIENLLISKIRKQFFKNDF